MIVNGEDLRSGNTKSCGCARDEALKKQNIVNSELNKIDIGTKFNKLTVIEDLGVIKPFPNAKYGRRSYKCQCDCGNITIATGNQLKTGGKQSCGCLISLGENKIAQELSKLNINYKTQYRFDDFYGTDVNNTTKSYYRYDFGVLDNDDNLLYLIEFDGRQHYTGPEASWTHAVDLATIQQRDEIKTQYAKNHNIPLIRIPYYEIQNMVASDLLIETSRFIV